MAVIERELVVDASVEEAFDYIANFESCAEWDPGVAAASRQGDGPAGVGTRYDVEVVFNGKRLPMVYEVTEWSRPSRVVLVGTGSTVRGIDTIEFVPEGEGRTRIRYRADLRLRGLLGPVTPMLRKRFEALGDAAMAGIKVAFAVLV